MSDDYQMHIEQAARGCCGGKLGEWPVLHEALKRRGHTLPLDASTLEVKAICKLEVELATLREQLRIADAALEWYGERSASLAEKDWKNNPDYVMAIFTELHIDGGRRSKQALDAMRKVGE